MAKVFARMTIGLPADGQAGDAVYVAGTPVTKIRRVYKMGDVVMADVTAPGYRYGATHGLVDKKEEEVESSIPLDSIIFVKD